MTKCRYSSLTWWATSVSWHTCWVFSLRSIQIYIGFELDAKVIYASLYFTCHSITQCSLCVTYVPVIRFLQLYPNIFDNILYKHFDKCCLKYLNRLFIFFNQILSLWSLWEMYGLSGSKYFSCIQKRSTGLRCLHSVTADSGSTANGLTQWSPDFAGICYNYHMTCDQ